MAERLTRPLVFVILARAGAGAQPFRQGRTGRLQFGVVRQRFRAVPQFQQGELVGIEDALEDLELLATRVFPGLLAARLEGLRELGALAGRGGDRDDEADGHGFLPGLTCRTDCEKTSTAPRSRDNNGGPTRGSRGGDTAFSPGRAPPRSHRMM